MDLNSAVELEFKRLLKECTVVKNCGTRFGNPEGLSILDEVRSLKVYYY